MAGPPYPAVGQGLRRLPDLNRPIDALIERSGLALDTLRTYNMGGPDLMGFAYEGIASKPG